MKEFVEKLISRLEEKADFFGTPLMGSLQKFGYCMGIDDAIEIVNQLAEEYNPKTNVDIQEVIDNLEIYTVGRLNTSKVEISVLQLKRYINRLKKLAEEYKHCIKSSCSNCEVYDKEKHYCPKWCEVIKHTTSELAEEHNGGWISCSERLPEEKGDYLVTCNDGKVRVWWFVVGEDFKCWRIGVHTLNPIAWQPLPSPYTPPTNSEIPNWQQQTMNRFERLE